MQVEEESVKVGLRREDDIDRYHQHSLDVIGQSSLSTEWPDVFLG